MAKLKYSDAVSIKSVVISFASYSKQNFTFANNLHEKSITLFDNYCIHWCSEIQAMNTVCSATPEKPTHMTKYPHNP